jgi:hypothetical protein
MREVLRQEPHLTRSLQKLKRNSASLAGGDGDS